MKLQVAIIGSSEDTAAVELLRQALISCGDQAVVGPSTEPRELLRWAMSLEPDLCAICIFTDTDGRLTASLTTALHPAITPVVWAPSPSDPARLSAMLGDTPALLSFVKDPAVLAHIIHNLLVHAPSYAAQPSPYDSQNPSKPMAKIEPINPQPPVMLPAPQPQEDHDLLLYRQLESAMAAPVKKLARAEPVQIQKPALDFSLPLRRLMTQGSKAAQERSQMAITGAHYIAALDEPYISAFAKAGLAAGKASDYLDAQIPSDETTVDPVVSDEVFEAVVMAKEYARKIDVSCVRVADFLRALLLQKGSSVSGLLESASVTPEPLLAMLDSMDVSSESCGTTFFNASPLDQGGFYEFDEAQVQTVADRLKDLPGFQKAAERVSESRGTQPGGSAAEMPPPQPVAPTAPDPPDKPEVLKITGEFPSVDAIEYVADRLLEGHLVAFPADTMFALAADAANPAAVARLREATGLPDDRPLSILINSTSQLRHLVMADLDALEDLFDELWPGPLTLIFKSSGAIAKRRNISTTGKVAVRQPADNTSLSILSMLGRPLAVTSWDLPREQLAGVAGVILDDGTPPSPGVETTVIDLTKTPWQILRQGAIPAAAVLGYSKG